jgi:hypothetical protein
MDGASVNFVLFIGLILYPAGLIASFIGGFKFGAKIHTDAPTEDEVLEPGWVPYREEPRRAVVPGKVKSPNSELR